MDYLTAPLLTTQPQLTTQSQLWREIQNSGGNLREKPYHEIYTIQFKLLYAGKHHVLPETNQQVYDNHFGNTKIICQYINSEQMDLKSLLRQQTYKQKWESYIMDNQFYLNWRIVDQTHSHMALLVVHRSERAHWTHDGMQEL